MENLTRTYSFETFTDEQLERELAGAIELEDYIYCLAIKKEMEVREGDPKKATSRSNGLNITHAWFDEARKFDHLNTYQMYYKPGAKGIKCLVCGNISFNKNDIAKKYCGHCKIFH